MLLRVLGPASGVCLALGPVQIVKVAEMFSRVSFMMKLAIKHFHDCIIRTVFFPWFLVLQMQANEKCMKIYSL